jgi:hypothetical protein
MCSDFSFEECEKTTGESASQVRFTKPDELWAYLQEKRPRNFASYMKNRERLIRKREAQPEGPKTAAPSDAVAAG